MNEIEMTVTGNVAVAPSLRRTGSGHAMTSFRVASSVRRLNRETGEWEDGTTTFFQVTCWRSLAENVQVSVGLGDPVVVQGRFSTRPFIDRDGRDRLSLELDATSVGLNLRGGVGSLQRGARPSLPQDPFAQAMGGDANGSAGGGDGGAVGGAVGGPTDDAEGADPAVSEREPATV